MKSFAYFITLASLVSLLAGCRTTPRPGDPLARRGDEIMVAGQLFHTGTKVVLWGDPGGYDAYRVDRRFGPIEKSDWATLLADKQTEKNKPTPNRYGTRRSQLTAEELERVRGGGWDLPLLQRVVDQFVLHYDVAGVSRTCFRVLHDERNLSVHFMLDLDGTIYQTLDLKERAWHASTSNDRSVGIEIANIGAYRVGAENPFDRWYQTDSNGVVRIKLPERLGDGGILTSNFVGQPARTQPVRGTVQGMELEQYDFTPEQYAALTRLTAALCRIFPEMPCRYPVDEQGKLVPRKLDDDQLAAFQGVLGHYHIQANKQDPGPAFDWEAVVGGARKLLGEADLNTTRTTRAGNAFRR
jgi:N-acetyl-anhydromuramyl-L-alanine amidase AmpD